MSTPSNISPQDRLAALKFATNALTKLDAVHHEWISWETTGPAAKCLKPVNDHLRRLTTMLADTAADHFAVAHDLGVIVAQLMNDEALLKPLMDIAAARQKILGELQ